MMADKMMLRRYIFMAVLAGGAGVGMLGGCVQVSAPERTIEISLNITIRQEVVVRLQDDARQLIDRERGVF